MNATKERPPAGKAGGDLTARGRGDTPNYSTTPRACSPEAERAVLGACLINGAVVPDVLAILGNGCPFIVPEHAATYEAIRRLYADGAPVDLVTVSEAVLQGGHPNAPGPLYLSELSGASPTSCNAAYYAGIVAGHARTRHMAERCRATAAELEAADPGEVPAIIARLQEDAAPGTCRLPLATLPGDWRAAELPARQFAFSGAFPLGCVSSVIAQGGGGKSTLILEAAASLCIGRPLIEGWTPTAPGRVLYLAFEDDLPEIQRRLKRIAWAFGLTPDECGAVAERLRVAAMPGGQFFSIAQGGAIEAGPDLLRLAATVRESGPFAAVILDPKSALLGGALDENANPVGQRVVNLLTGITGPDAALVLVDHVAKADREGATSGRGAGAWGDAARQVWALRPLNDREAREVPDCDRAQFAALECRKTNYTGPRPTLYMRRHTAPEAAGVLEAVDFEGMRADAAGREADRVEAAILEVLARADVSRAELTGHSGGQEARKRGTGARELIADRCPGVKITTRKLEEVLPRMIADGLITETVSDSGRVCLRAVRADCGQDSARNGRGCGQEGNPPLRGVPCPHNPTGPGATGQNTNRPEGADWRNP